MQDTATNISEHVQKTHERPKKHHVKESKGDRVYYAIVYVILALLALIVVYPLYFVVIASFSSADAVLAGRVYLFPVDIDFTGYIRCFERTDIWIGYGNTIWYTAAYTVLSVVFTVTAAWALSRKTLPFRKFWMIFFTITMFFGGGLIPFYKVVSDLGLLDNPLSIILPGTVSAWNLFMAKTFFQSGISDSIIEAAELDGAGLWARFRYITMPSLRPTTFYVMVNMIIGSFNVFIQVMMLTGGNPNGKTSTLQYLLYDKAFNQFAFGEASAIGMISAVTIVILTVILNRTLKLNSTEQEG